MSEGKKVYIYAKDIDSKRKLEIKAKKFRKFEKGLSFWVTLIQAVVSKTLRLFYKIFFLVDFFCACFDHSNLNQM